MTGKGLPKRGIPPFCKGREEEFSLQRPYNYGLISKKGPKRIQGLSLKTLKVYIKSSQKVRQKSIYMK